MPEETAHGTSRRADRRLAEAAGVEAFGVEPSAMRPVIRPSRSVTAAISAGQVSVGAS
jgi:hypothetical protein